MTTKIDKLQMLSENLESNLENKFVIKVEILNGKMDSIGI